MSFLHRIWPGIYALFLGIVSAYLVSGLVLFKLKDETLPQVRTESFFQNATQNRLDIGLILKRNILGVRVQEKTFQKQVSSEEKAQKVTTSPDIEGYKLIGFATGAHPMALFKKVDKPVVIVDEANPLNKHWFLKEIRDSVVYMIDKNTGEIKTFKMEENQWGGGQSSNVKQEATLSIERFKLKRKVVEAALKDVNQFFKQVRIEPYFQGKRPIGYRLGYLSNSCILRKVGLRRGDIIISVNGQPTTEPAKMMGLFNQMREMTSVNLDILRNGKKKTFFVEID